jgi:glycosyltransferase involved in cell wall biosynthesis
MPASPRRAGTLPGVEVCTIIAKNYVAHARVLARSLAEHNPGSRLWTLLIDDYHGYVDPAEEPFEVLTPAEIDCEPFTHMALRYTVLELSTAVKPWLLRHLLDRTGKPVTYLDPDIRVYASLTRLDELAARHGVALIPHNKEPLPPDGRKPSQVDVMIAGVYNLGYVSLASRPEVDHLLEWWADRLRRDCRVDPIWGYFVDQRWFDLVPGFLTDFAIVREPEYNVAYWNLHSRRLELDGDRYLVDGRPLAFFHFSGFDPERPLALSRHQDRIDVAGDATLERLLREYADEVMAEGHAVSKRWPYSYVALGDGTEIDDTVRAFCEQFADEQERADQRAPSPFTLSGARAFHDWLGQDAPGAPPGVSRLLAGIYADRPDLQQAYPDVAGRDREGLLWWARELGPAEVPLLARATSANGDEPAQADERAETQPALVPIPDDPWGVNVVGYLRSPGERGEVVRQLVSTLDAGGIPSAPVEDRTRRLPERPVPYPVLGPDAAPYPVTVICSSAEGIAEFARQAGQQFFAARYTIGWWFDDAPVPEGLGSLLQELWVPTARVAEAVSATRLPVTVVPAPVQPSPSGPTGRAELGLPEDAFVYVFNYDATEGLERQNPIAVIEAFRQAFKPGDGAQLLVNCIASDGRRGELDRVRAAAEGHPGVEVIEASGDRTAAPWLTALCDCYVSLHRAEPVGLAIGEAMWLGKPVIATGNSANLEFLNAENALLVDLVVAAGEDSSSAEPDLEHAARLMRSVFEDPAAARALGTRAAIDVRRTNSPAATLAVIGSRLQSIRDTGYVPPPMPRMVKHAPAFLTAYGRVTQGPPAGPRGGRASKLRGALRTVILRAVRPYSDHQQKVNMALLGAIEELRARVDPMNSKAAAERAEIIGELRSARQLRRAVEVQARSLDEVRRVSALEANRALYLALAELGRRHAALASQPGEAPGSLGLAPYELRGYSQNGEDGAIVEALRRIGTTNRFFVEFGVESGQEGNCVYLADVAGWGGLFMEADDRLYQRLERKYGPRRSIRTVEATVTPENIERLLEAGGVPAEPDVMSIDVDGQDYWIWEAIHAFRPRLLVIEYNSALDPGRRLVQPREAGSWDRTEYFGASLGAIRALGEAKGYRLVHTELAGSNAFLVRAELAEGRFLDPADVSILGVPNYYQSGYRHPPDERGRRYLDLDTGELVGVRS